mgnify:CR=1 FL=1
MWVTSGSPDKLARARSLGAAGGANYREADWPATLAAAALWLGESVGLVTVVGGLVAVIGCIALTLVR